MKNLETVLSYGIPITHDSDQTRVGNSSKKSQEVPQSDLYGCSEVKYSALRGMAGACSNGTMYSCLNMYDVAGL